MMIRNYVLIGGLSLALGAGVLAPLGRTTTGSESAPAATRAERPPEWGAQRWRQLGYRGQGIKIAVLDTGFRGWRSVLGKGLPKEIVTRSFRADGNLEARDSQHGLLCAEVLHTLAPDAPLLFANWDTDNPASFLQAVRWAKDQGARIITCSVIMPNWSDGEGGGAIHAALNQLLGTELLFFASAGNTAQRHWCGWLQPNEQGWHCWHDTCVRNMLEPWGSERIAVELYGPTACGGELSVVQAETGAVIGSTPISRGQGDNATWSQAIVRFDPDPRHQYQVCLKCLPTDTNAKKAKFHLVVLGGNLGHGCADGSIPFPADGARVVAVGAVDRLRWQRTAYSSCGPNSRLPKPDFMAPVPFASQLRERPFSGTSAAAPQAAALAALYWSRQPTWNADRVRAALRAAAVDLGPPGHDWETGYGLINLP